MIVYEGRCDVYASLACDTLVYSTSQKPVGKWYFNLSDALDWITENEEEWPLLGQYITQTPVVISKFSMYQQLVALSKEQALPPTVSVYPTGLPLFEALSLGIHSDLQYMVDCGNTLSEYEQELYDMLTRTFDQYPDE